MLRSHPGRWIAVAVGIVLAALGVAFATQLHGQPVFRGGRLLGKPVPAFDLPTLGGPHVRSRELVGRAYIVNFWNSWCIPCRQEHPALDAFYRRHARDPDFAMIGIVRDDTRAAVRRYVAETDMEWTVAFDPGGEAALDFGTTGQPETYVVSPAGVVVGVNIGPSTVADLEAMLARARASN